MKDNFKNKENQFFVTTKKRGRSQTINEQKETSWTCPSLCYVYLNNFHWFYVLLLNPIKKLALKLSNVHNKRIALGADSSQLSHHAWLPISLFFHKIPNYSNKQVSFINQIRILGFNNVSPIDNFKIYDPLHFCLLISLIRFHFYFLNEETG